MSHPLTLPVMGASLFLSVAAGIHLGETTVGLINPLYFQGPALHPRDRGAAVDESRLPIRGPVYSDHYGWEEGSVARAADCLDCEALAARDVYAYSAVVPYFGAPAGPPREADDPYAKVVVPPSEEPAMAAGDLIVRYAHYPVATDPVASTQGMGGPEEVEAEVIEDGQQ